MGEGQPHVLIIDDETNIRAGLREVLAREGYQVRTAQNGEAALSQLANWPCDVAIVDIRMPGMSGVAVLEAIRSRWPHTAVVMLTGHGTLESAMAAIRAGAQDYLLKPARPETIRQVVATALAAAQRRQREARLLDALRTGLQRLDGLDSNPGSAARPAGATEAHRIQAGSLLIDLRAHQVLREGQVISLSPTEFRLLVTLVSHRGEALDYATLVEKSLGYTAEAPEARELIKRHIFNLRRKIEPDPAQPTFIHNVRGVGYRFDNREAHSRPSPSPT